MSKNSFTTLSRENNTLSTTLVGLGIALSIFVFYSYQYILRLLPNSIKPQIELLYSVNNNQFADFAGFYYLGYVLLHMPLGLLISRFGGKLVVPISMCLTGAGVIPIFLDLNWYFVILGRFLSGVGSSCAAVAGFQFFRNFYPDKYSRMIGIMMFFGLCTAKFSEEYLTILINNFGLHYILQILFIFSCVLSLVTYFFFPDIKTKLDFNILLDLKNIIFDKKIAFLSLCAALMVGSLEGFSDAWGSAFLTNVYFLDKQFSDYLISYIFIGMALGTIVLPYIADKFKIWYNVTLISAVGMFCAFIILLLQYLEILYLKYLFFVLGFFCAYQAVTIPMIASYVNPAKAGFTSTLANMIVMFFGTVFHKTIGSIIHILLTKGYNIKFSYIIGVSSVPTALIISFICMVLFKIIQKITH